MTAFEDIRVGQDFYIAAQHMVKIDATHAVYTYGNGHLVLIEPLALCRIVTAA